MCFRSRAINIETETAEEGIRLAQESHPALILMDIQLPGIDGVTALKRLKADPKTRDIPVVDDSIC